MCVVGMSTLKRSESQSWRSGRWEKSPLLDLSSFLVLAQQPRGSGCFSAPADLGPLEFSLSLPPTS